MPDHRDETRLARQRTALVSLKVPSSFDGRRAFSTTSTNIEISLIDIETSSANPAERLVIKDEEEFKRHLIATPEPHTRIISICSKNSIFPLLVTQSAMQALLDRYDIGVEFLDFVHSFGQKPRTSDAGHGRMTVHRRVNGAYDTQYLLPYVERYTARDGSINYTDRWVAVFNRYSPEDAGQNLWIFLHPQQNSEAQQRIESAVKDTLNFCNGPSLLHLVTLSSYIGNWRLCIRSLGQEVEEMMDKVILSKFTDEGSHTQPLAWLGEISVLREKLLPLEPKLRVVRQIVGKLDEMSFIQSSPPTADQQQASDSLAFYLQRVEGHLESLEVAVDLGNRNSTGQMNKRMLELASHSASDSAAVKVITILTMIYLPPSFVSTFLGTNLFKFDDSKNSAGITISKGIWLFFVLWIPLSAGTFLSWRIFENKDKRRRQLSVSALSSGKDIELGPIT
ncbi:hypothetical protein BJX99DRAFT_253180 [Aspergillus californicus]